MDQAVKLRCMEAGFDEVFQTPITIENLKEIVIPLINERDNQMNYDLMLEENISQEMGLQHQLKGGLGFD